MSKLLLCIVMLAASLFAAGQSRPDSVAILRLLEKEGTSWRSGDVAAHADCWVIRPYSRILASGSGGSFEIPPSMMLNPPANMVGQGGLAMLSNIKMSISGNSAWVSHDEISVSKDGNASPTREVRMLEKVNGQWKLVGQSMHGYTADKADTTSYIHTVDIETGAVSTVKTLHDHFEAPNWHPDNYLILNSRGKIYTLDLMSKQLKLLNTGFATACNNDHGISPDKKWLVISHADKSDPSPKPYKSAIYILPIGGGEPRRVTSEVMSFWHGWTPDGKTLAYCAERKGNYDVYTISTQGGREKRLTQTEGLDDGPDYSPDGKYIYFNSFRSGRMQIWRMLADGSHPEQLTFDENSNWFAHPSPDNKWIVWISYTSDEKQSHPFGRSVRLRLMNLETRAVKDLTPVFFGGQGTINVPSWSADSKHVAFVSYSIH